MNIIDFGIVFLLLLTIFTLIMFFVGPKLLLQPSRSTSKTYSNSGQLAHPSEIGLPCNEFNIITNERFKLFCWAVPTLEKSKGTIIYFHGIGDNKALGIPLAKLFFDNGFNTLLFDFRAHGESEGKYCTYGYYEKFDAQKIIDEAVQQFPNTKIGLYGLSMGAAIALQKASIDKRVSAVVSENSFSTLRTIFDDYQKRMIILPFHYLRNLIINRSEQLASFDAKEVSPLNAVKKISVPLLFIYGKLDNKIHYRYSIQLFENACASKELFPVENASHANVREIAGNSYDNKLISFYEQHLQ